MDFEKLTLDGFIDTELLQMQSPKTTLKLLANEAFKATGLPPSFQIMVENGHLEVPIGTALVEFEVADLVVKENFVIMEKIPNPLIGLCFRKSNNAIFDVTQGILTFPYPSMQRVPVTQTAIRQPTPLFPQNTYTLQPGEALAMVNKMPQNT